MSNKRYTDEFKIEAVKQVPIAVTRWQKWRHDRGFPSTAFMHGKNASASQSICNMRKQTSRRRVIRSGERSVIAGNQLDRQFNPSQANRARLPNIPVNSSGVNIVRGIR